MDDVANWKAEIAFGSRRVPLFARDPVIDDKTFSVRFDRRASDDERPTSVCISWKNTKLVCVSDLDIGEEPVTIQTHKVNGTVRVSELGNEVIFEANLTELRTVCDARTLLETK